MIRVTAIRNQVIPGLYVENTLLNPTFPNLHSQFSQNRSKCIVRIVKAKFIYGVAIQSSLLLMFAKILRGTGLMPQATTNNPEVHNAAQ
jgi:hypothetical protein